MGQDQPIQCQKMDEAGIPCGRSARLSSTHEVYRENQSGEQYLYAIHYVIICPHCGAYVHVEKIG